MLMLLIIHALTSIAVATTFIYGIPPQMETLSEWANILHGKIIGVV